MVKKNKKRKKEKKEVDELYLEFIEKVAEANNYNKEYYEKNKERMRKYQRKYLKEIRFGIIIPKKRNGLGSIIFIRKKVSITFD